VNKEVLVARSDQPSVLRLILVPAVITLAVTLLRLAGERMGASSALFSRAAGGGGALVGIVWLVPVFGFWFGWRLARAGQGPGSAGRVALYGLAAAVACIGLTFAGVTLGGTNRAVVVGGFVAGVVAAVAIAQRAWPELFRTLFAYALAARIPVALIMLAAIYGNWGTHYDVPPPDFPVMGPFGKWLAIGLLPQLTVWITFTVAVGSLLGALGAALAGRGAPDRALGHAAR
jgi:hypothetical protein